MPLAWKTQHKAGGRLAVALKCSVLPAFCTVGGEKRKNKKKKKNMDRIDQKPKHNKLNHRVPPPLPHKNQKEIKK